MSQQEKVDNTINSLGDPDQKDTIRPTEADWRKKLGHLQQDQVDRLVTLLTEFSDVFWKEGALTPLRNEVFHIDYQGKEPRHHKPYPLPPYQVEMLEKECEIQERAGLIREVTRQGYENFLLISPVFYKEEDTKFRRCHDYRFLNQNSAPHYGTIPDRKDILRELAGKTLYTVMDVKSAYNQIALDEATSKLLAFVTPTTQRNGQKVWIPLRAQFGYDWKGIRFLDATTLLSSIFTTLCN